MELAEIVVVQGIRRRTTTQQEEEEWKGKGKEVTWRKVVVLVDRSWWPIWQKEESTRTKRVN